MSADRRNPYLVLGVQYGATRDQATRAFAQRSRRARRDPDFPYSIDDLTWALNHVEEGIKDPAADIDTYRVPADPAVLKPPTGLGLLRRPAQPIERRTPPTSEKDLQILELMAIREELLEQLPIAAERLSAEYGFGSPIQPVVALGEPKHVRRWWLPLIVLAVVTATAVAIAVRLGGGFGAAPKDSPAPATTKAPSPPPSTVAIEDLGPISTYAPDNYDSSSWTSIFWWSEPSKGSCFNFVVASGGGANAVPVDCQLRHRYQIYEVSSVFAEVVDYEEVVETVDGVCLYNFQSFVGSQFDSSIFGYSFTYPDEGRWPLDRQFVCYLQLPDERAWVGSAFSSGI